MKNIILYLILAFSIVFSQEGLYQNLLSKNFLDETPIYPLPKEMTFEEYQDMNRNVNMALLLSAIPIPGSIHSYAGEKKIANRIRWIAAGSILTTITGLAFMGEEQGWQKSNFETKTFNEGLENESRYEMIPTGEENGHTSYKYRRLEKEYSGGALSFLAPLGIGVLLCDYLYDFLYGIKTIERKRAAVRFKYGKELDFSFNPTYNYLNKSTGLNFSCNF